MNEITKECGRCHFEKALWEFSPHGNVLRSACKKCRSEEQNARQKANPEKTSQKGKTYYQLNKANIRQVQIEYRGQHREKILSQKKEYYQANKQQFQDWSVQHRDKRNQRLRERRVEDVSFRVSQSLRARVHDVLKSSKRMTYNKYIGVDTQQLIQWIDFLRPEMMTWDRYGIEWVLDHVLPIAAFDLTIEANQFLCFNWSNLRPLLKTENENKGSKIILRDLQEHIRHTRTFLESNHGYQATSENLWWLEEESRYGKNPEDEVEKLQTAIRSLAPKFSKRYGEGSTTK